MKELRYEDYMEVLQRWMTPEELDQLRKELGHVAEILERNKRVEKLIENQERKEAIWQFLKAVLLAFASIVAVLATIKAVLPVGWLDW
jgi:hypothetical protein